MTYKELGRQRFRHHLVLDGSSCLVIELPLFVGITFAEFVSFRCLSCGQHCLQLGRFRTSGQRSSWALSSAASSTAASARTWSQSTPSNTQSRSDGMGHPALLIQGWRLAVCQEPSCNINQGLARGSCEHSWSQGAERRAVSSQDPGPSP